MTLQLQLENSYDAIPEASEALARFLELEGAGESAQYLARLALEELVTNIVKYGYDDHERHIIHLEARTTDGVFSLSLTDDGHAFNPCEAPAPDTSLPADERPIGGLGLFLVRNMADSMSYERRDDLNIVTVTKALPDPET